MSRTKTIARMMGFIALFWPITNAVADTLAQDANHPKITINRWHISLAVGLGLRSNPLVGGDNLPLVLLPDISYYGERWYFDNGDIGYTFIDDEHYSVSLISRFNGERSYFSFLHPANLFQSPNIDGSGTTSGGAGTSGPGTGGPDSGSGNSTFPDAGEQATTIDDIAKRRFAVDGGVQFDYFASQGWRLSASLMQDISGVYDGQNGFIELSDQYQVGQWQFGAGVGLTYKSARLVDYYYGLHERDNVPLAHLYQGRASTSPFVKFNVNYPLTPDWQFIAMIRYQPLASGIKDSPIVAESAIYKLFMGVSYGF